MAKSTAKAGLEENSSLVLQGYQVLRDGIVRGDHLPGSRLKLHTLQRSLGLSSSPLREALNRLVAEGLVDFDDGRGFRSAEISVSELEELTDLRLLLETEALRRSVATGNDDWEARVVSASHTLRRSAERSAISNEPLARGSASHIVCSSEVMVDWSIRHREYHMALLSGCRHRRLIQICGLFFDQAERYRSIARMAGMPRPKLTEHELLTAAVLNRDVDKAADLLKKHITKTTALVIKYLEKK